MRRSDIPRAANALDISYALANVRNGALLEPATPGPSGTLDEVAEQMEGLAAALPDLLGTVDPSCLDRICSRMGGEDTGASFGEILLISPKHTHVIHLLPGRPGVALLAMSPATGSIGLILSAVRARIDQLGSG